MVLAQQNQTLLGMILNFIAQAPFWHALIGHGGELHAVRVLQLNLVMNLVPAKIQNPLECQLIDLRDIRLIQTDGETHRLHHPQQQTCPQLLRTQTGQVRRIDENGVTQLQHIDIL